MVKMFLLGDKVHFINSEKKYKETFSPTLEDYLLYHLARETGAFFLDYCAVK